MTVFDGYTAAEHWQAGLDMAEHANTNPDPAEAQVTATLALFHLTAAKVLLDSSLNLRAMQRQAANAREERGEKP